MNSIDLSSAEIADREIKIIKDMEDPQTLELVVVIKPENHYFTSRPGLGVKPLEVHPLGPRSSGSSCSPTKDTPPPRRIYVPTEINTVQVDGLARIPGLTQALDLRKPHTYASSSTE